MSKNDKFARMDKNETNFNKELLKEIDSLKI